jgi:hypothetical protein
LSEAISAGQTGHVAAHNDIHDVVNEAARYNVANTFAASQTISNNGGKTTLALTNTTADVGLTIGGDTNLYRSAANTLKTDDEFAIGINGGKDTLALTDTTADVGLTIGGDTNLYRSAANVLQTDDDFRINQGAANANLFLKTSTREFVFFADHAAGDFGIWNNVGGNNVARWTGAGAYNLDFLLGDTRKVLWSDVNLYRSAANELATDDIVRFNVAGTFQTTVGAAGGGSALPATPTKYLKIKDEAGTMFVVPCYAAA